MLIKQIKKLIIGSFVLVGIGLPASSFAWTYPIKEVSKVACKFTHWSSHDSDCKIPLPKIIDNNYHKYKKDISMRLIYSVLWAGTYKNGWDVGYGSHLGTDIATAKGTPVYTIGDGEVVNARYLKGWGNTVTVKHKFKGKYIFSNYTHLSKINVTFGEDVSEGEKIGEVGNTGNSWGNHLHFQIDVNQYGAHPYYYNCAGSPATIVDAGLCQDKLYANTIDPIEFLETNGANIKVDTPQIVQDNKKHVEEQKIDPKTIIPREKLMLTELEYFLNKFDITSKSIIQSNVISPGRSGKILIEVKHGGREKTFHGNLPMNIEVSHNDEFLDVSATKVKYINNGVREIKITGKKVGTTQVVIKIGGKIIGIHKIRISDKDVNLQAKRGVVKLLGKGYVGGNNWGLVVMKDSHHYNIVDVSYAGNFSLTNGSKKILCPANVTSMSQISKLNSIVCTKDKLTNKIDYSFEDTLKGLLIFKVLPQTIDPIQLAIKDSNGKTIGSNAPAKIVKLPYDLKSTHQYYRYIKSGLYKGILTTYRNSKNFAPNFKLKHYDGAIWIKNAFPNGTYKNKSKAKDLTRLEFMKLISELTGIKAKSTDKKFWDIKGDDINYANILVDYGISFKDQYGEKYFQPNNKITRGEAAFILDVMTK